MFFKLFKTALLAAFVAIFVQSLPDIRRYMKIRQM
jgi:hypothetical protein